MYIHPCTYMYEHLLCISCSLKINVLLGVTSSKLLTGSQTLQRHLQVSTPLSLFVLLRLEWAWSPWNLIHQLPWQPVRKGHLQVTTGKSITKELYHSTPDTDSFTYELHTTHCRLSIYSVDFHIQQCAVHMQMSQCLDAT